LAPGMSGLTCLRGITPKVILDGVIAFAGRRGPA